METGNNPTVNIAGSVHRLCRLWLWFASGFLLVFVVMLLLVRMTMMHPSGQYVVRYPLWRYYGVMVPRLFGPSTLGPVSGGTSILVETVAVHLLFSAAGGCAAAAIGWGVCRFRNRRSAEPNAAPDRRTV
jgi:hypothetical protein